MLLRHHQWGWGGRYPLSNLAVAPDAQGDNVSPLVAESIVYSVNLRGEAVIAADRARLAVSDSVGHGAPPSVRRRLTRLVVVAAKALGLVRLTTTRHRAKAWSPGCEELPVALPAPSLPICAASGLRVSSEFLPAVHTYGNVSPANTSARQAPTGLTAAPVPCNWGSAINTPGLWHQTLLSGDVTATAKV